MAWKRSRGYSTYGRRFKRRRYRRVRRRRSTLRRSTRRIARRAYRIAKRMQSNIETKFILISSGAYGPATMATNNHPTTYQLTNLGQGTAINARVGLQVTWTRLICTWQATVGDSTNFIRFMIWKALDQQPGVSADIIDYYVDDGLGAVDVCAFRDWPTRRNIKVLYSKLIYLDNVNAPARRGTFTLKLNMKSVYEDSGNSIGSLSKGALYLSVWSDSSAVTHPGFGHYTRMYFQDA